MLSFSQFESYPKVCMRTSLNPGSCPNHSCGQKSARSSFLLHVFREPPPRPCMKTTSAMAFSSGRKMVVNPSEPLSFSGLLLLVLRKVTAREKNDRSDAVTDDARCSRRENCSISSESSCQPQGSSRTDRSAEHVKYSTQAGFRQDVRAPVQGGLGISCLA